MTKYGQTKLNCEVLNDDMAMEVRWAVAGESIVMQLVGKIADGNYMSFGLSGDDSRSQMIGGDVVVGWFEKATGKGHVVDYYLDSKSQCSGKKGTCPDARLQDGSNNVRLLSAAMVNGFTMLTYQRPLAAHDDLDKNILTNGSQTAIWAVGPLNQRQEASYHQIWNKEDLFIEFGRTPKWNCPAPEDLDSPTPPSTTAIPITIATVAAANIPSRGGNSNSQGSQQGKQSSQNSLDTNTRERERYSNGNNRGQQQHQNTQHHAGTSSSSGESSAIAKLSPWRVPPILCHEPEDRVFYAQMGPTGGKRGYSAITGQVGWGISWYINGLLIPEIYVVRGKTYTFIVEGGKDPEVPAKYHPFYITDDPEGGYQYKTNAERQNVRVFAGVGMDINGGSVATATGRLCQWTENNDQPADSFASYGAYQRSLSLNCEEGPPGVLTWTPDETTPDLVYYQCYTHRYLGWKIHVVDGCDSRGADTVYEGAGGDQEEGESIHHATSNLHQSQGNYIKATGGMGGNPVDSGEGRPGSVVDGTHGKAKPTEHKGTLDKSQLNEKQEVFVPVRSNPGLGLNHGGGQGSVSGPVLLQRPQTIPNTQYVRRPVLPGENVGIPGSGYIQVPTGNSRPHAVIQPGSAYGNYGEMGSSGGILRNPEAPHSHPYLTYGNPYSQRVLDGSHLIYEPRPGGLDYFVGATGRPALALGHPGGGRYESVPLGTPIIYASTMSPPASIMTNSRHESGAKVHQDYGNGGGPIKVVEGQGPVLRLKQAPSSIAPPLSGENIKYIDYVPPHFHTVVEGAKVNGRQQRPQQHQSRNLAKREKLGREEADAIRMGLRSIGMGHGGDESMFEVIRINDTAGLPFHLPKDAFLQPVYAASRQQIVKNVKNSRSDSGVHYSEGVPLSGSGYFSQESRTKPTQQGSPGTVQQQRRGRWAGNFDETRRRRDGGGLLGSKLDQVHDTQLSLAPGTNKRRGESTGVSSLERFDLDSLSPQSGGFYPVLAQFNMERKEGNVGGASSSFYSSGGGGVEGGNRVKAGNSRDLKKGGSLEGVTMTSLEPMFRPSPQDTFSVQDTKGLSRGRVGSGSNFHQLGRMEENSASHRQGFGGTGRAGEEERMYRMEKYGFAPGNMRSVKDEGNTYASGRTGNMFGGQWKDLGESGFEIISGAATRKDVRQIRGAFESIERAGRSGSGRRINEGGVGGIVPRIQDVGEDSIVTYDGRVLGGNNGGVSVRPSGDPRTPSILQRPQFGVYRGELPPLPIPSLIPGKLPQLERSNQGRSSSSRDERIAEVLPAGSKLRIAIVAAPSSDDERNTWDGERAGRTGSGKVETGKEDKVSRRESSSKVEIVPSDGVRMVVLEGTDERGWEKEVGRILHQLQETDTMGRRDEKKAGRFTGEENQPDGQTQTYHQNSTDLHILTDIWSTINQDDGARESGSSGGKITRGGILKMKNSAESSSNHPGNPGRQLHMRYKRESQGTEDRRRKRSPDHEPGHIGNDDHHDHKAENNIKSFASSTIPQSYLSILLMLLPTLLLR